MIQRGIDLSLFIVRQIVDVGVLVRELLAVPHQGRVQGSWPFLDDGVMLCCHSEKWFRFFCVVRFLVWLLERRLVHGNYGRLYRCSQKGGLEDATKRWEVDLSLSCPPHFASLRAFHIFPRFYDTR